jgi:hypothetical protein
MTTKVKLDGFKNVIRDLRASSTNAKVGEHVIGEIKKSLAAGVSPVKGERRFQGYSENYPGKLKPKLPVNLKLTGKMLGALRHWIEGGRLMIGIRDPLQAKKAKAHNEGKGHMPKRHFLPTERGDSFNVTITRSIRNLYAKLLSDIINKRR